MSARFRKSIFIGAVAMFLNIHPASSTENLKHIDKSCDGDDCSATLSDKDYEKICESKHIFAFWDQKNPDRMILQCPCDCTMESNINWLIDGRSGSVSALAAGRFVLNSFIAGASVETEVPDRFGTTRFCAAPRRGKLEKSMFVVLFKHPYNNNIPYCYEIGYVSQENGKFAVLGDSGLIPISNKDYWMGPVSNQEKKSLLSIWRKIKKSN